MAIWVTQSRNVASSLKIKIGFLASFRRSYISSSFNSSCLTTRTTTSTAENFGNPCPFLRNSGIHFILRRFESLSSAKPVEEVKNQALHFLGGNTAFTSELTFISEFTEKVHCYRVLDENGHPTTSNKFPQVTEDMAVKMYRDMVTLQIMDTVFYEAQRQGRISFYATSTGEEAITIASAAALAIDDVIVPQYREPGVLIWRGFTLQDFANQCYGNKVDNGKGRQMPVHYGSNKYNYFTVASTIASQLPHAVGAAYSLRMDKKNACAVTFFGDGGSSEGDCHASLNFAAVLDAPVLFICRNNGWAISTPASEQFRSDGIAVKGQAYGIRSIRVDGNDALAVYNAVRMAREMAIGEQRPILIEAVTYRVGHHSTSDDSTRYRPVDEIEHWRKMQSPLIRFRKWIQRNGWWSEQDDTELQNKVKEEMLRAIQVAEKTEKPPLAELFTDVYDHPPKNLQEQETLLREYVKKHPQDCPSDVPL
ncbi:3-methyl-2-oxobutanoate dehydrogenase (2-methylpropanoyl-transferring) [Bertholletia excelsa]